MTRPPLDPCVRCNTAMRRTGSNPDDHPGTIRYGAYGHCCACWRRVTLGLPGPALHNGNRNPPAWDVDDVAVDLATSGARVTLNPAERALAIQTLTDRAYSARLISLMLGCSKRTVERHRSRSKDHACHSQAA